MAQEQDLLSDIEPQENFGYTLASPWIRLGGVIIEGILIYLPLALIFLNTDTAYFYKKDLLDWQQTIFQAAINAVTGALFYSMWSGNLGHKILGLKVISAVDGSDQKNAGVGALREVLKSVLGTFILPSIWLLWDAKKQNLYDKITKTLVVVR